jgi:hypothetical protein
LLVLLPTTAGACQQSGSAKGLLAPASYQGFENFLFISRYPAQRETFKQDTLEATREDYAAERHFYKQVLP